MSPLPKEVKARTNSTSSASATSERGRKEDRDDANGDDKTDRKRKRSRKGLDKKYLCPQEDCGKSYSRAEHLYRHQLNHSPKQIYKCDYPDCPRWFVRQDLCTRHRERHTTRGSHLQRKDAYQAEDPNQYQQPDLSIATYPTYTTTDQPPSATTELSPQTYNNYLHRSHSDGQYYSEAPMADQPMHSASFDKRHQSMGAYGAQRFNDEGSPTYSRRPPVQMPMQQNQRYDYVPQQQFPALSMPPAAYTPNVSATTQPYYDDPMGMVDSPITDNSMPIFDSEGYTRSPVVMADNFAAWLFNDQQFKGHRRADSGLLDPSISLGLGGMPVIPPQHSMAVTSILDSTPGSILSELKRKQVIELIENRFNESSHSPVAKQKEELLSGDRDDPGHVLSLRSMQTYIGSYWYHFHDQMPILHQPTFSADKAQNLLLIAVIAIGAANLDKIHGEQKTNAGAELANFFAWHLRGELFMDQDFRPPAKLWVLQTLLLLEAYEKLYSSRVLHERAQIHHATTISLLRRGSSLLGRSAMDSPPNLHEPSSIVDTPDPWWNHWITNEATKRVAFAAFIIDSTHATMFSHTAVMVAHEMRLALPCDESLWSATSGLDVSRIEAQLQEEGVKPMTFLDGLKWTLNDRPVRTNTFGRTALMAGLLNVSFHLSQRDMQVRMLGVTLGGKDMWRGTLTKAFDIWERDWDNSRTNKNRNAASDPNSSNHNHMNNNQHSSTNSQHHLAAKGFRSAPGSKKEPESEFESRVVLHHLAHMGMHVDVVQCQIYARAKRLLGRTITPSDYNSAARRMREVWAPKASARDAVFYSLSFIRRVLMPSGDELSPQALAALDNNNGHSHHGGMNGGGPGSAGGVADDVYSPRDDYALNRPWVLYFAALVVWSYGFALEGPLRDWPRLDTKEEQVADMYAFMRRVGGVNAPDDLSQLTGRNCCAGLLFVLRAQFRKCRWELMHEASTLLGNCITMLKGEEVL